MSYKSISSLLSHIFILSILLALAGQALAARGNPKTAKDKGEMKQPEWLLKSDHSVLIPGIGRVMVPPAFSVPSYDPYTGHSGSGTGTGTSGSHIPGGDDTFVPNPGYEVPTLGSGSGTPRTPEAHH